MKKIIDISLDVTHDLSAEDMHYTEVTVERQRELGEYFNVRRYELLSPATVKRVQRAQLALMEREILI